VISVVRPELAPLLIEPFDACLQSGATPGARSAGSRVWVPLAAAIRHGGRVTPRILGTSGPGQTGSTGRQLIKGPGLAFRAAVRRLRDRRRAS
jgi:hypothetical protein